MLTRRLIGAQPTLLFLAVLLFVGTAYGAEDAFLVQDIQPGTASSTPTNLTVLGSKAYFSAAASGTNTELWMSDGTNAGTVLVREIRTGATGSAPSNFAATGSYLFFVANDGVTGAEPYASNGTVGNATLLMNIRAGATGSSVANQTAAGTKVYFTADDGSTGVELYVTDGTAAGTSRPRDIRAGGQSSAPALLTALGNSVIFEATDGSTGVEPYVSDGTTAGTFRLVDIRSGGQSSDPTEMKAVSALGLVFFDANAAGTIGRELYKTNGTSAGTVIVADINAGAGNSNPTNLSSALGLLFFSANSGANGIEPYVSNGTAAGTVQLANINAGAGDSNPYGFTQVGSTVFFAADGPNGIELYKTDGTAGGTSLVEDIRVGGLDSTPSNLTAFGTKLFFTANDGSGIEPWISDGTAAGTFELADINGGGSSSPSNIVVTPTYVYFTADDNAATGIEWWRTDGTVAGTMQVHDIRSGGLDANVQSPVSVNGYVLFGASNGATGAQTGQELWGIEYTYPTVVSIVRASANPTNAATVAFTVTFSEGVSGVNAGDFAVTTTGTLTGATVQSVTPVSTSVYTVTVAAGTGAGTLRLDVDDNDSIQDLQGSANPLGGTGNNNGNFTGGEVYTIDREGATVALIVRIDPNPTIAASVNFSVTFSENVSGVNAADFALTTAGISGAGITGVVQNSASNYTVTVSTGSGSGTIRLDIVDDDSILDGFSNPLGGAGAGNGNYTAGPSYSIDHIPPSVVSIVRADPNPTNAAAVSYTVTFNEDVTGVGTADFGLTTAGVLGASVSTVTPVSASVYTVSVTTGSGSGSIRLDLSDDDSIADIIGNPLGGAGVGNGDFTAGESYTIDKTAPVVSSIVRASGNPTNALSVSFTVTFSEGVSGVNNGDFVLTLAGVTGASVTSTTQVTPSVYTVVVGTGSNSGTLRLDLSDNDSIQDAVGNRLGGTGAGNGNFTGGEDYTIDKTPPAVTSIVRVGASPTSASSVQFTVTFGESVSGVDTGDFTLNVTGVTGAALAGVTPVSAAQYTVTVNTGAGSGTIRLDFVDNNSVTDVAGNPTATGFTTGESYTLDRTGPTVSSITRLDADPTASSSVNFQVTFNENVTGVDGGDFAVNVSGVSGASVGTVTQNTASTYTVAVNTGSGSGSVRLDFVDNDSVLDSLNNPAGGAGAGNGNYSGGQTYTLDRTGPAVLSITRMGGNPTNNGSVSYLVTFNESVNNVDNSDFVITATGTLSGASITSTVQLVLDTEYQVTVNTGTGSGTLRLDVDDNDSITDDLGNPLGGPGNDNGDYTSGEAYTVDRDAPVVTSIVRAGTSPTNAASVSFTVTFSEDVTGVGNGDFVLTTSGVTATSITSTTQVTPSTYTVVVNTGAGTGTIRLDLSDNDSIRDAVNNRLGGTGVGNGDFTTGEVFAIDRTAPAVLSINRAGANPSGATTVPFTVTFSEGVTGVDTSDFALNVTGVTGASISGVSAVTASTYTVTVNTGSGSGTIRLNLTDNDSIRDLATNPLGGAGAGNGNFAGQQYTIDKSAPTVSSIVRVGASPTNAASVGFTVTFSETVTGVDTADFALTTTGTITGTLVSGVTPVSGTTYTVTVNTGSGNGTLRLDFADNDSVTDSVGNPVGGAGAGNGNFTSGEVYTIDKTAPTAVITLPGPNPTRGNKVDFSVVFSESIGTSFTEADITVTGDIDIGGRTTVTVTGSGTTFNVEVKVIGGSADAIIGIAIGTSVFDLAGNAFGGGTSPGTYSVDNTTPTATITLMDPSPTTLDSVRFSVVFSESVGTSFGGADVTITGTLAATSSKNVSGSTPSYTVTITPSDPNADGTIGITLGVNITDLAGNAFAGGSSPSQYVIDNTSPAIASVTRMDANPTSASSVTFNVTVSENVTGVDAADFALTTTGVSGASISGVAPVTGSTYSITVNTGSGSGTIRLDVLDDDSIADGAGNRLGGVGAGNGGFTSGEVYTIDRDGPSVVSIVRTDASPTGAASVNYTVTFNEDVSGVGVGDFALTTTGLTGAAIDSRTQVSPSVYTVTVTTGTGTGTIRLDLDDNDSIRDALNNPLGGTGAGNGNFAGEVYSVDRTPPSVVSIVRTGASPTNASVVQYTVSFNEDVSGVGVGDFSLTTTGVTGATITSRTQVSAGVYTVNVSTGSGNGTIRLDLNDNDSIEDLVNLPLGGIGAGNGDFAGEVYTVDKSTPSMASLQRVNPNPTAAANVAWDAVFSESVDGVDATDFAVVSSGVSGAIISGIVPVAVDTFRISVNTGTGNGTIRLNFTDDDSIVDAAGNPVGGSGAGNGNFTGQQYTVQKDAPNVTSIVRGAFSPTNSPTVPYVVTFSENVTGVDAGDFGVTASGVAGAAVTTVTANTSAQYTVVVSTGTGSGTIRLDLIDNDSIRNANNVQLGGVGNGNGNFTTGHVYTVDRIPPQVASIDRINSQYTSDAIVTFAVSFDESVSGVATDDFAVVANGPVGATVLAVHPFGMSDYEVDVNTGSGDGTLQLALVDNDSISDGVNQPLGGVGAGNGDFVGADGYIVDRTPPVVTISAPLPSITRDGPVIYQLFLSGADFVYLNESMITLNATGTATGTVNLAGSGNVTRHVTITDISGDGTLSITVSSGAVSDLANNTNVPVGPSAVVDVSSTASVPVNPWFLAAMLLAAAGVWFVLEARRMRAQRR